MKTEDNNEKWLQLSPDEKRKQLYINQKKLLEVFLERGAITRAQFEKSLGDLTEKMGYGETDNEFVKSAAKR